MSRAIKSKFPWTVHSGCFFAAVLLVQIAAAQIGQFCLSGSILLVASFSLLPASAAGLMFSRWLRNSTRTVHESTRTMSVVGIGCVLSAVAASVIYAERWVHPTENIMGGQDEAIYAITAVNLARTGHYHLNAELLPSLPAELRPWIIRQLPRMANRTVKPSPRYPCYHVCLFIADEARGTLSSQFPVGFPALLGSLHSLFGFDGQRMVNPVILFTTACLAGALATSWLGIVTGVATFVLWLWFPLQVWSGNTHFAEVLLQLLWLLTLLGLAERTREPLWSGVLAGLALGVSLAVKIDALPVWAATSAVVAFVTYRKERGFFWSYFFALGLSTAVSATVLWQDNRAYALDTIISIVETNRRPLVYGAVIIAAGIIAYQVIRRFELFTKANEFWPAIRPWIVGALIGGGGALAAYAYFVRSHPTLPDTFFYWPRNEVIRSYREDTFVRLGWYWQPWGLALAVVGMGAAIKQTRETWQSLLVGVGLVFLIAFAYDIRNDPIEPYALRRFLPYAFPFMIFGAAAIGHWLLESWRLARSGLTGTVAVGLLLGFWPINQRLSGEPEFSGLIAQVTELAEKIPNKAVVLISATDQLVCLASSAEFIFGKPCVIVHHVPHAVGREKALRHAISLWNKEGHVVYLLSPKTGNTLGIYGITSRPMIHGIIQTKETAASDAILVTKQTVLDLPYTLNELTLSLPSEPAAPNRSP